MGYFRFGQITSKSRLFGQIPSKERATAMNAGQEPLIDLLLISFFPTDIFYPKWREKRG
jgi:hypothetical protein